MDRNFIGGGNFKADGVCIRWAISCVFLHFNWQSQSFDCQQQSLRNAVVAFEYAACEHGVTGTARDRIGQLIRMQDGAPAGGAADHLPAALLEPSPVYVGEGLGMPEGETGRIPRI